MGDGEDLGALGQQVVEAVQVERALTVDRDPAQRRPGAPGELLPRHEVGVVLHLGDEDLVTRAQHEAVVLRALGRRGVGERVGDEVDRLGGVLGEDDLVGRRADERRDGRAGRLEVVGRLLGELVRPAVHRRVVLLVERPLGVEHRDRLVRRGPGVEIDEGTAVAHRARQDRELAAQCGELLIRERTLQQKSSGVVPQAWTAGTGACA